MTVDRKNNLFPDFNEFTRFQARNYGKVGYGMPS
jgi:hypothetical protein